MQKSKIYIIFGVLSLVISLVAISLAYAGFSSTLNVNSGAASNSKWDVHFSNLKLDMKEDVIIKDNPSIKYLTTVIEGGNITFNNPHSYISYTFEAENNGTLDALLNGLLISRPLCDNLEECNNVSVKIYDVASNTELISTDNSKLISETGRRTYQLVLSYEGESSDITLNDISIVFNYVQDNSY